ncbi:hypothetical protein WICANDRAFT_65903 [Wickerhamomyces anomalus NRRL Y-366-8]|uniref:Retrovirus-related Pol polyprotein from transposon TNT 1-94-like beta-barrel domain-containing protein n=1 Tax=Wickerhamomyces anomalus (strain ATCC 58044 / CBS 1984 / NCYC 433 / NRRL Y-366-8) TaxID=683960 RepID=A0A1E3NTW9_WICAA|nr:uncharacterized protein WICANDRAFT_65903 [Wickerhamomyces anomalus NRRL Y-366-8]ODQ56631.1 hypothetical protein WICANDRAFT_65903 [Wickerhamomyces anomalus NRRL Y-366-8]
MIDSSTSSNTTTSHTSHTETEDSITIINNNNETDDLHQLPTIESNKFQSEAESNNTRFILDSGASVCVTNDEKIIDNLEPCLIPIKLADGSIITADGQGTLKFQNKDLKCVYINKCESYNLYQSLNY